MDLDSCNSSILFYDYNHSFNCDNPCTNNIIDAISATFQMGYKGLRSARFATE